MPLYIEYFVQFTGILVVLFYLFGYPLITCINNVRNNGKVTISQYQFLPFLVNSVWAAIFNVFWVGFLYCKFVYECWIYKFNQN